MPIIYDLQDGQKTEYEGCVLADREENGYDDSDFYAVVYDRDKGKMIRVDYASTRFAGSGYAKIDATEEIKQLAKEDVYRRLWNMYKYDRRMVVGTRIRVIKGRKVPLGTEGIIRNTYERKMYQHVLWSMLICEDDDSKKFKTYPLNVEVIAPSDESVSTRARAVAENVYRFGNWHLFFCTMPIIM